MTIRDSAEHAGQGRVNYDHARSPEEADRMRETEEAGECTFCPDFMERDEREIVFEGEHWVVTPNQFPYENTHLHLLIVPKRHVDSLTGLNEGECQELLGICQEMAEKYEVQYGGLGMRFGDMRYSGATISHIHMHLIVAEKEPPAGGKRVRFAMGPKPPSAE